MSFDFTVDCTPVPNIESLLEHLNKDASIRIRRSVSIPFYRGNWHVNIGNHSYDLIALHVKLLAPTGYFIASDETEMVQTDHTHHSKEEETHWEKGVNFLEEHWKLLHALLLPSITAGRMETTTTTPVTEGHYKLKEDSNEVENNDKNKVMDGDSLVKNAACMLLSPRDWAAIRFDAGLMDRLHYSYMVVLNYFGWRLHDTQVGVVDRHHSWANRYKELQQDCDGEGVLLLARYVVWGRTLRILLEFRLYSFVKRWLLFLLEEFAADRLLFLVAPWEKNWLPLYLACEEVDQCDGALLRRKLRKLSESDSD